MFDLEVTDVIQVFDQQFACGQRFDDVDPIHTIQPRTAAGIRPVITRSDHFPNACQSALRRRQPRGCVLGVNDREGIDLPSDASLEDVRQRLVLPHTIRPGPRRVGHGIRKRPGCLFANENCGAVGRAFENLHGDQVVHHERFQPSGLGVVPPVAESSESVARPLRLEHALRDDEPEPPAFGQVVVHRGIREQHRNVLLAAAQTARGPGEREESVPVPERLHAIAVAFGQVLPIHPRRVACHVVHSADEQRREGVLDDARPNAVLVVRVESLEMTIEFLVKGYLCCGNRFGLAPLDELVGRIAVADAGFERVGVAPDVLAAFRDFRRDGEIAGAGLE